MNEKFTTDQILKVTFISFRDNSKYFLILGCIYSVIILIFGYLVEPENPDSYLIMLFLLVLYILIYDVNKFYFDA